MGDTLLVFSEVQGTVTLGGSSAGARVLVDGREVGRAPVTTTLARNGEHVVRFVWDDGSEATYRLGPIGGGWRLLAAIPRRHFGAITHQTTLKVALA
jgi:hypothetical protein